MSSEDCVYCGKPFSANERSCDCLKKKDSRAFRLWIIVLLVFVVVGGAGTLILQMPVVQSAVKGHFPDKHLIEVDLAGAPQFFAKVIDRADENGAYTLVSYEASVPVVVRNRSKTVLRLQKIAMTVASGHGELILDGASNYGEIGANSTYSGDIRLPIVMDKFDALLKGWKLPQLKSGDVLEEDFGRADVTLFALNEKDELVELNECSRDVGRVALALAP